MADQKDTRRVWTDAERDLLIAAVAEVPKGHSIAHVLKKWDVTDSAFRSMRRRRQMRAKTAQEVVRKSKDPMQAKLDPLPLKTLPPAVPVVPMEKQEDFRAATKTRKLAMIAEYKRLPKEEKKAWQEAHNVTQAVITYYTVKHKIKAKITRSGKHASEELPALVAEYYALPHVGGHKRAWLDDHGLNHQNMFDYRRRVRKMGFNGASNGISNPMAPAVIPTVRQSRTAPHAPIAPTPTLQDGVNYLQIKRDLYNEIIEDLNRVLKGGR